MSGSRSTRLAELDALRGIAALIVVVHHTFMAGLLGSIAQAAITYLPFLYAIHQGRPAVIFFFVLSGFVLTRSLLAADFRLTQASFWVFVAQRTIRLCLPVFGAVCLSALLWRVCAALACWPSETFWFDRLVWSRPPDITAILRHTALIGADGDFSLDNVLWSLVHEWRISLLIPLVAGAATLRGKRGALVVAMSALVLSRCFEDPAVLWLGPTIATSLTATVYFCLPFALGSALALCGPLPEQTDVRLLALVCCTVAALFRANSDLLVSVDSVLLIWVAQQPFLLRRALNTLPLIWLGRVSYSLYLVHLPVLAALVSILHGRLSQASLGVICVATSLAAAGLFYRCVEHPAQRLARLIGSRGGAARPLHPIRAAGWRGSPAR